jgi:hypothetical protein
LERLPDDPRHEDDLAHPLAAETTSSSTATRSRSTACRRERIARVYLVYRDRGDTPNDIAQTIVELAGDEGFAVFEPETGFAGRVNFERQPFLAGAPLHYWVAAPVGVAAVAPAPGRVARRSEQARLPPPRPRRARRLRRALAARRAADLGRPQAPPHRAQPPFGYASGAHA